MKSKIILITACFMLASFAWFSLSFAEENIPWKPIIGNEHTMIVQGVVDLPGFNFGSGQFYLYSFGSAGEQDCRSVSAVQKDGAFFATVRGNKKGEMIIFKIYDNSKKQEFFIRDVFMFQPDGIYQNIILN